MSIKKSAGHKKRFEVLIDNRMTGHTLNFNTISIPIEFKWGKLPTQDLGPAN